MKFSLYADKSRHQLIIPYFDLAPRWKGEEKLGKSRVHHQPNLITTGQVSILGHTTSLLIALWGLLY